MADQYQRKINYMRISITDLCNMRCLYCMPEEGIQKKSHKNMMSYEEMITLVKASVPLGINKLRITGGEPLVRRGVVDLIYSLAAIEGINEITMTTNGSLLEEMAEPLKKAGLTRFNISIDSLKEERYKEITRGGELKKVMNGIDKVIDLGMMPVKLNTVMIGGYNEDELDDFANLTYDHPIDVRFIELMPVGQASHWAKTRFISNETLRNRLGLLHPLKGNSGSPAKYYQLAGAKGKIGFINPISDHFCGECNRIRLTSDGKLKPCLHSNVEFDVLMALRKDPQNIENFIRSAIDAKPERHHLNQENAIYSERNMFQIGG
ncbi:GTP 3',8-cyclase MoaA [Tindallia californiensis]|uniref:GTP 3',8-cyclase n=1 Tax=Tindallia californiensis TaxID=159292 RepID=A0A1H3K149_9FIRM|nr:GTP 3',8-cyclase MoaA [Tindallia californiensis]SDY45913.1 cyclic pyranopterin monophosphate synthase subunit MoaA [Tindallia californiensis]